MLLQTTKTYWSVAICFIAMLCLSMSTNAHNKVVVIPLPDDTPPRVFAPMKTDNAPREDYFILSETVRDLVTGLTWQREGDGFQYSWEDAEQYCQYLYLDQQSSWRLPTIKELIGITDYTRLSPALSVQAFPNNNLRYWSSTLYNYFTAGTRVRTIYTPTGRVDVASRSDDTNYVRCVLDGNSNGTTFIDNGDGTVLDLSFGLMWEKSTFQESNNFSNLAGATNYCLELSLAGFRDWRMPSVKELVSLLQPKLAAYSQLPPVFNHTRHPEFTDEHVWSKTNASFSTPPSNWVVRFGSTGTNLRRMVDLVVPQQFVNPNHVGRAKCVRNVN